MRVIFGIVLAYLLTTPVFANEQSKKWTAGIELDILPYFFDGYYISVFGGYGKFRGRVVRTELTAPDFATQSGFEDNQLDVNAIIVDYFFEEGFKGWWISPGLERWHGAVTETNTRIRKDYSTNVFTFGGGYIFRITTHFYINPWAAIHIPIGGDTEVEFTENTFNIEITPQGSIKLGIDF